MRNFIKRLANKLPYANMCDIPKVSVIIPVYNVERYLRDCLDSITNQSLKDIEIICVNDGSTDNSLEILHEYAATDSRISIITQENKGLSAARNAGLDAAKGNYIYFIDSDDMLSTDALGELYSVSERENTDVLFFDCEVLYDDEEAYKNRGHITESYGIRTHRYDKTISGYGLFAVMMENDEYLCHACRYITRTKHIRDNGLRFYDGILHEDNLYTFKNILLAGRAAHISGRYYLRRVRMGSIMTQKAGFRNFYGYLVSHAAMQSFAAEHDYPHNVQVQIKRLLDAVQNNIVSLYTGTQGSNKWLYMLNEQERCHAELVLGIQPEASALLRDTQDIISRYGARRVMWQAIKIKLYPCCPQWLLRLYRKAKARH